MDRSPGNHSRVRKDHRRGEPAPAQHVPAAGRTGADSVGHRSDVATSATVRTTITMLVDQAITLAPREFVYAPIRSRRLTSRSMKNSTNGNSTPLATCDTMITFINGRCGSSTKPEPTTIRNVYSQ